MTRTLEALSRSEASIPPASSARLYAELHEQGWRCYRSTEYDSSLKATGLLAEQFFNYHSYSKGEDSNHYNQPPIVTFGFDFFGSALIGAYYSNGAIVLWKEYIELWIDEDTARRFQYPPVTQGTE